jgi:hypothetical protein
MKISEFFASVFYENVVLYFLCLLFVGILTIPLFKKYTHGIFDPFFFILMMTVFAYVIPLFLFITNNCSSRDFFYFIISETFLWLGVYLGYQFRSNFSEYKIKNENVLIKRIFFISILIYIFTKLYTYMFIGVPLLMEYRLDIYTGTNGLGMLGRLSDFATFFLLIYAFYLKDEGSRKYLFILVLIFIDSFLSGSKSAIFAIFQAYFIYSFFYKNEMPLIKKKHILLLICFPILILLLSQNSLDSLRLAVWGIFIRMVANGDVFWYSYPYETIDQIKINHPFANLFVGILSPFRLIDYNTVEPSIGKLINWQIEPSIYGTNAGSNARPAIAGWIYFRWYGIFFSFFIGCFISFLVFYVRKYFSKSLFGIILFGYLYQNALTFIIDPSLGFNYLSNFIINIVIYTIIIFIVSEMKLSLIRNSK